MPYKYIMVQVDDVAIPIIFPGMLVHADVWKYLRRPFYDMAKMKDPEVVGAGFIEGFAGCLTAGESETLHIESRPQDVQIINIHPYAYGREGPLDNSTEVLLLQKTIELLMLRKSSLENGG
jgi:hypothetical protein